jgi:hypothetical protein
LLVAAYLVVSGCGELQIIHTLFWVVFLGAFGLLAYDASVKLLGEELTS